MIGADNAFGNNLERHSEIAGQNISVYTGGWRRARPSLSDLPMAAFAEALASGGESLRALKQEKPRQVREAAERVRSDDRRREAKAAFDAGDNVRAAMLYELAGGDLRPAERKRLDIARRRRVPAPRDG
jgi:hypothetical protein